MVWDPASLTIQQIMPPNKISTADVDVTIGLIGTGFDITMTGVFVLHVDPQKPPANSLGPTDAIPCNWFEITEGDYAATLRICPRRKTPGVYDLIVWTAPPDAVYGEQQVRLPVNSIYVFPNAITVLEAELETIEKELEQLKERLGRSANEGPILRSPSDQPTELARRELLARRICSPRSVR